MTSSAPCPQCGTTDLATAFACMAGNANCFLVKTITNTLGIPPAQTGVPFGQHRSTSSAPHSGSLGQPGPHHAGVFPSCSSSFISGAFNPVTTSIALFSVSSVATIQPFFSSHSTIFPDPDPLLPLERAGIRAGEITAFRFWEVNGCALVSANQGYIWPFDGPAQSDAKGGEIDDHNHVGLYSFKEKGGNDYFSVSGLEGECAIWGTIIEHEWGYRSEFARPTKLYHHRGFDYKHYLRICYRYKIEPGPNVLRPDLPPSPTNVGIERTSRTKGVFRKLFGPKGKA